MGASSVRAAAGDEIDALVATLADGFHEDPLYGWLHPDPLRRSGAVRSGFALVVTAGLDHGLVHCTEGASAVAVWTAPGVELLDDLEIERYVALLRREAPDRADVAADAMAACAAHRPDEPHWFLHAVAVARDAQGTGVGTPLLRHALSLVDADGSAAYLESSAARNLPFYERLGFEVVGEVAIADDVVVRPMIRPVTR